MLAELFALAAFALTLTELFALAVFALTLTEMFALAAFALVLLFALKDALAGRQAGRG